MNQARWYRLSQISRQAGLIVSGIFLAKSELSLSVISQFELLLYLGTLISFFWVDGWIKQILTRHGKGQTPMAVRQIFNVFLLLGLIGTLLLFVFKGLIINSFNDGSDIQAYSPFLCFAFLNFPGFLLPVYAYITEKAWPKFYILSST